MTDALRQAAINSTPLRFSRLKLMGISPAHYAAGSDPSSSAIAIGNAADQLILTGAVPLVFPGKVRRGKEWDAWSADHEGELIVTAKELAAATGMAKALRQNTDACRMLDGLIQQTMYWDLNGRSCRGTPDVRGESFLTDLKTGETSDPRFFPWKVRRFAYHAQLAWYRDGAHRNDYGPITDTYIVAIEQAPPYVVTPFRLNEHLLEIGDKQWRTWFEHLRTCEESGRFPGYSDSIVDLDLPDPEDEMIEIGSAGETSTVEEDA